MAGFCKFYNENNDEEAIATMSTVIIRSKDYLNAIFL